MTNRGRIRLRRLHSTSMPDVSAGIGPKFGASPNHGGPSGAPHHLIPVTSAAKTAAVRYDIDDDAWVNAVDSTTGSVFYVATPPPLHSHTHLEDSLSSSSSLSSSPSVPDFPPSHPLSSHPPRPHSSPSERLSHSLAFGGEPGSPHSYQFPGFSFPDSPSSLSGISAHVPPHKPTSLRKRLKRAVKGHTRARSETGDSLSRESSLSEFDLSESPPVPHGALYGSQGVSLHDAAQTSVTSVRIDLSPFKFDAKRTPCSLDKLGIVPAQPLARRRFASLSNLRLSFKSYPPLASQTPVMIREVVPGSPAAASQQLMSGDTIMAVNGQTVDLETINDLLARLSNEVIFVVRRHSYHHGLPAHSGPFNPFSALSRSPSGRGLVRLLARGRGSMRAHARKLLQCPHILLYLTLDTKEDDPADKDIIYRYPTGESWCVDKLVQLRGLFLTLSDVVGSITGATSSCSTIVLDDDQLVHLGYVQNGKELLLLAMPALVVSQYEVQLLVENIEKTLQLLYNSVHRAFSTTEDHSGLDHLFSLLFDRLLAPPALRGSSPLSGVPATSRLKLSSDIRVRLSTALSQLCSADHSPRAEVMSTRRPFLIRGACLFYKGSLASSQMREGDLSDVVRFCLSFRLLEFTSSEAVTQMVIWREIHLSSTRNSDPEQTDPVYAEHRGRSFLLIVGQEHVVICMLMECSHGDQAPPTVDATYINKGRNLILELRAQDLLSQLERKSLLSTPLPSLSSADIVLASLFTATTSSAGPTVKQRKNSQQIEPPADDSESDDDDASHQNSPFSPIDRGRSYTLFKPTFKPRRKRELSLPSVPTLNHLKAAASIRPANTLTSGLENLLLHYVSLNPGRGVMICPTHATPPGAVHSELLLCFQRTALAVREVLMGRVGGSDGVDDESEEGSEWGSEEGEEVEKEAEEKAPRSPFSEQASSAMEYGVMMQCSVQHLTREKHKNVPILSYWVVGRLFPDTHQELYVCFQDSVSQNVVEMAFRLLFGSPG